jgi:rhodanese-related sulfurtransferase
LKTLVDDSAKGGFALIDSRPHMVNQKEFIPGSISIPWVLWEQKKGLLPADKDTLLVFYCGGHHCDLSHFSASEALKMGYKKVRVYAEGIPAWKKAGHGTWGNDAAGIVEAPKGPTPTISAEDLLKGIADKSIFVVDVRSEREFNAGHMPGAVLIPDGEFYNNMEGVLKKLPTDKKVAIVCATGARSGGAFFALQDEIEDKKYVNSKGVVYLPYNVEYKADGTFEIKK